MAHRASRACQVAAAVFGVVCALHAVRLLTRTEVIIGGWRVPMTASAVGLIVSGLLAAWLWGATKQRH